MKNILFIILLSTFLFLQSCAQPTDKLLLQGEKAYQVQDYHTAFTKLITAAKADNPNAEYAVGYMYYYGLGVKRDTAQAIAWFKKAADAGQYNAIKALELIQNGKQLAPRKMSLLHKY